MPDQSRDLTDAMVVVAGATGGLGSRIVGRLHQRGARVLAVGRDKARLDELPDEVIRLSLDLTQDGAVGTVAQAAGEHVVGLVNAAGAVAFGSLADTDDDVIAELLAINTRVPLQLARALLPRMGQGSFIANLSGVIAEQPMAGLAAYSASKAGLAAATTALRREVRRDGIDVIDLRAPHTETGLASRPLAGTAPKFPDGADPDHVVDVIMRAIDEGARDVSPDAFG